MEDWQIYLYQDQLADLLVSKPTDMFTSVNIG
jgi:hypothetical protein